MTKTIILIDDDEDDLHIMKEAITEVDSTLMSISYINPEHALQAISNELTVIPDYFFIDINMAPFTGDKCLQELRRNPKFKDSVIAMFSTSIPKGVQAALMASGANFTFEKPDRFEAVCQAIRQVLRVNRQPGSPT